MHHFFTTVFRGIEKYANGRGYNVIICVSDESFDKEVINMELLANGSIDGFIMSLSAETQQKNDFNHLKEVTEQGIPLVLFDRVTDEIECDKVIINDKQIAYTAVKKLIGSGKRKIALVTTDSYFNVSKKRAEGYMQALVDNEIPFDESRVLTLPYKEINKSEIEGFFKENDIDAVLCVNEVFAIHCMGAVQELGKKIPDDVSFIGFTNGMLSRYSTPGLTSIAQHGDRMGAIAAQMLIEKIETEIGEDENETYRTEVIEATLIERESTIN